MPDGTSRFSCDGAPVMHYMGTSTFANFTVLPEIALAKIREDAPFEKVCYIGCGVTTGIGAVMNTAKVERTHTQSGRGGSWVHTGASAKSGSGPGVRTLIDDLVRRAKRKHRHRALHAERRPDWRSGEWPVCRLHRGGRLAAGQYSTSRRHSTAPDAAAIIGWYSAAPTARLGNPSGPQVPASRDAIAGVVSSNTGCTAPMSTPHPWSNTACRRCTRRYQAISSASLVGANFHITNVGRPVRRSNSNHCNSRPGSMSTTSPGAVSRVTADASRAFCILPALLVAICSYQTPAFDVKEHHPDGCEKCRAQ